MNDARNDALNDARNDAADDTLAHEALEASFHGRLDESPTEKIRVYALSSKQGLDAYLHERFRATVADPSEGDLGVDVEDGREIFANLETGPETLAHELAHLPLEAGFPSATVWLE